MDKYRKASFEVVLSADTPEQADACKRYKALMLEVNAPKECLGWSDEKVIDFAMDFILEVWKSKQE
jgi:hypothetical protein